MTLVIPIFLLGLLASLSPTTIIVFILLLATTRARVNAVAFLAGWGISLIIVFAVSYAVGGAQGTQRHGGRTAVDLVEIVLGVSLVAVGAVRWRRRNVAKVSSGVSQRLTTRVQQLHPWQATIVGVLKQPWALTAAAALVVVRHHTAAIVALIAFLIFTAASTATLGVTFFYFARRPREAEAHLSVLKDRLVQARSVIFATVLILVGLYLTIDGAVSLLSNPG
jgi:hypothetical protein